MKKVLFLFLAVMLWGCCTTPVIVEVPMKIDLDETKLPQREILGPKADDITVQQHLLNRVAYYSELVKLWESWAVYVYETLDKPIPESLK